MESLRDIVEALLINGLTTPSRIHGGLEIYNKGGVIKYFYTGGSFEGIVLGDSGAVHVVRISRDGYMCSCGDVATSKYLCKHAVALIYAAYSDSVHRRYLASVIGELIRSYMEEKRVRIKLVFPRWKRV